MSHGKESRSKDERMPRAMMSRADLVRALVIGDDAAKVMADTLGLEQMEPRVSGTTTDRLLGTQCEIKVADMRVSLSMPRIPFWRVEHAVDFEALPLSRLVSGTVSGVSDDRPRPPTEEEIRRYPRRPLPKSSPIVPWSRLRPALAQMMEGEAGKGPIDLDRFIERWSRVERIVTIPRMPSLGGVEVHVVVDRARRLVPFWSDQRVVLHWLKRSLGQRRVRVHWNDLDAKAIGEGVRVLALTDLGLYGSPEEQDKWRMLGERLCKKGGRIAALVPYPRARWKKKLQAAWNPVDWSDPGRGGMSPGSPPSEEALKQRADDLLKLLSGTMRIEPGLLREVRQALPRSAADIGSEADAWQSPALLGGSFAGSWMDPSAAKKWREEYPSLPAVHRLAAVNAMRKWHERREYGLWETEVMALGKDCGDGSDLREEEIQSARRVIRRLLAGVPGFDAMGNAVDRAVQDWFEHFDEWIGDGVREDAELGPEISYAKHKAQLPFDPKAEVRDWRVRQQGGALVLCPVPSDAETGGSPIAEVSGRGARLSLDPGPGNKFHPQSLAYPDAPEAPVPDCDRVELIGDSACLTLGRIERPDWARAMGRDPYGLWAEWTIGETAQCMRWIPPGRFMMGSPEGEEGRYDWEGSRHEVRLTKGYWLAETPCTQALWTAVMSDNPSYFKSPDRPVEQVSWDDAKRFIEALNRTTEGSPFRLPTEAEWEYACRAGTETSTYAGELRILGERNGPILDEIAWYGGNSGVGFELENGWDVSDWKEKQYEHSRAGTHPVGRKLPNPWGLYDTLGNVLEWCEDWHGAYGDEKLVDPTGPSEGDYRVIRGGSWLYHARFVRAAYRNWFRPDFRYFNLGFRLARGQESALRQAGEGRSPTGQESSPRSGMEVDGGPGAEMPAGGGRRSETAGDPFFAGYDLLQTGDDHADQPAPPDDRGIGSSLRKWLGKKSKKKPKEDK